MSLERLISKCKKKDVKAQGELYELYSSQLFAVSLKYSRNYVEAQDHLQDSFVAIFNKIDQYKFKGAFEGWMKRIVINTVLQKYRGTKVYDIVNEENIKEETIEIDNDDIHLDFLLDIVQDLPDRYRLVFNLYALDGYSHKEISELLKINIGTSKSNLARARQILKEKIEIYKTSLHSKSI